MRRPFTALTAVGTAAHHGYELNAGVGLVFQPWMGLSGSIDGGMIRTRSPLNSGGT